MIIGLSGYAQSGKDTVANYLSEYGFTRLAFADPIRKLLYQMNPIVKEGYRVKGVVDAYGWDRAKVEFPEIRTLLQNLGLGARDLFGEDFWVRQTVNLNRDNIQKDFVVTDVRFINEAKAIKLIPNSQIWRVVRPGVEAVNGHVSETEMDNWKYDQTFFNAGTIEDLKTTIAVRMRDLR